MKQSENKPGRSILIVEDEADLVNVLSDILTQAGYQVTTTGNGDEGLRVAIEKHPDLILLDILMPKKDGIEMLKELRQAQKPPISSVIFFTNLSQMEKIQSAIKEGAAGYIIKAESSLEDIVKKVDEFFRNK